MDAPLHIVILAAGQGKRMRSARAKVLQPVAGRPLLDHVVDAARALDPVAVHVVVGHGADEVKADLAQRGLTWVHQDRQLGTGHAVQMALPSIEGQARVLVLLGDSPLITADSLRRVLADAGDGLGVLTAAVDDPTGYGRIVRDGDGRLLRIVEHKDADDATRAIAEVNSGVMTARCQDLSRWLDQVDQSNAQGEFYLTDCVGIARDEGRPASVTVVADAYEILGANDRWQLAELERLFQGRAARALCAAGATLLDPGRIDIRGTVLVGAEVQIDVNVVLEGHVELGDHVTIGPGCVIRDSRLGPGTRVASHSVLEGVVTSGDCDIGPFARLRPGTELARKTKVGNFVETKKAVLGEGSKASHLSYLGDTQIGRDTNIGAGTITCNYDGVNKFRTVIGDGVFVGSDTQLVAPVTVEDGATIGAGSTITKTVAANSLALSRVSQFTVEGWSRPRKKT